MDIPSGERDGRGRERGAEEREGREGRPRRWSVGTHTGMQDADVESAASPRPRAYWPQSYRHSSEWYARSPSLGRSYGLAQGGDDSEQQQQQQQTSTSTSTLRTPLLADTASSDFADGYYDDTQPFSLAPDSPAPSSRPSPLASHASSKPPLPPKPPVRRAHANGVEGDYHYHGPVLPDRPDRKFGSSFMQASFNGVNVLAGVGVLSTPYALAQAGWAGLLVLAAFAMICCYTGKLLRACLDSRPGLHTYPDIGEAAFGVYGRMFVAIVLYVELYLCTVEFLILEGDNLANLFPHFDLAGLHLTAQHGFVLITALIVLPSCLLKDLSVLSYLSAGGVLASAMMMVMVIWVGAFEGVGFTHTGTLLRLEGLPTALGIVGFCFSGHAVFPVIYQSMRKPRQFNRILDVSFTICVLLYGITAVAGYMMYGEDLSSQITLNLPADRVASKVAIWITVVNPISKFALTVSPVAMAIEELLPFAEYSPAHHVASLCIRVALVASTALAAIVVPFFGEEK
eukprot:jgi/Chlat1/3427/Chrsp23S08826